MCEHNTKLLAAIENDTAKPQVSKYIGEALLLICNNLVRKGNFSGYSIQWKQEMVSDALIDCISAVDNFKPDRTNNPFAYFTQIAWHAFLRRIAKEKKQTYIKHKNFENQFLFDDGYIGGSLIDKFVHDNDSHSTIITTFENKLTTAKKQVKIKGIEKFQEIKEPE